MTHGHTLVLALVLFFVALSPCPSHVTRLCVVHMFADAPWLSCVYMRMCRVTAQHSFDISLNNMRVDTAPSLAAWRAKKVSVRVREAGLLRGHASGGDKGRVAAGWSE